MKSQFMFVGLMLIISGVWSAQSATGQVQTEVTYQFSESCTGCHSETGADKNYIEKHKDFLVVTPGKIWSDQDKHSQAFAILRASPVTTSILGFKLEDVMIAEGTKFTKWIPAPTPEIQTQIETAKACLRCHATSAANMTPLESVDVTLGVSCQGCHGPAEKWDPWHRNPNWRLVSASDKVERGFHDVRNPAVKATICVGCHVGDQATGRFVKHEWYAKGHPPLPSFELAAFVQQMPAHWEPLQEKSNSRFAGQLKAANKPLSEVGHWEPDAVYLRKLGLKGLATSYEAANFSHLKISNTAVEPDPYEQWPRFQESVVGAIAALKAQVGLLKGLEKGADFAHFDCSACHHELQGSKLPPQRPKRLGQLGRPPFSLWPTVLLPAVEQLARQPAEKRKGTAFHQELETALTEKMFGNREKVVAVASAFEAYLVTLEVELLRTRFDQKAAQSFVQQIVDEKGNPRVETRDYASARVIAWSLDALSKDHAQLMYKPYEETSQSFGPAGKVFGIGKEDFLHLQLPSRRAKLTDDVPAALQRATRFDPRTFEERLRNIPPVFK